MPPVLIPAVLFAGIIPPGKRISSDSLQCLWPYGTEIHTLFRQYNYYFLGKDYWALRKLSLGIAQSARLCRFCKDMPCLSMCPEKIRIPDEIDRIFQLVKTFYPGKIHEP